jgi:hypothetical protein
VVVVKRVKACFGAERALVRDFGYEDNALRFFSSFFSFKFRTTRAAGAATY